MEISFEFKQNTITLDFTDIDIKELEYRNNKLSGKEGLYILRNSSNNIIYVGITNNLGHRVRKHIQGTTHTSYFHSEISSVSFYIEENEYEREALEKLLINALKPTYNETAKGLRRIEDSQVIAIKYLLGTRQLTQAEIADKMGVSSATVSNISRELEYADIEVPDGYSLNIDTRRPEDVSDQILTEIYTDFFNGKTISQLHLERGLPTEVLKTILSSTQSRYKDLRNRIKKEHREQQKQSLVKDIFRLRHEEGLSLFKIGKLKGLAHCTVRRYLIEYEERNIS